jgi:hypothetical protein
LPFDSVPLGERTMTDPEFNAESIMAKADAEPPVSGAYGWLTGWHAIGGVAAACSHAGAAFQRAHEAASSALAR